MWVRIHTMPKRCRVINRHLWSSKERYYHQKSYERYLKTEDGAYLSGIVKVMRPEIGRFENVRFIKS